MADQRIKDIVSQQSSFVSTYKLLVDDDGFTAAKAIALSLLGNLYMQGSTNGIDWFDQITALHTRFRFSTDGGVTWKLLNADTIPEGTTNKFLTATERVNIADNTSARHPHTNKSVLDNIIDSGGGTSFLADDGTYKSLGSTVMLTSTYDTDLSGIVDDSELLDSQLPSYYLSRTNHTGTQLASTISDFSTAGGLLVTYENLNANGDIGTSAGQVLNGDYRFDISEVYVQNDGTTSHLGLLSTHHDHTNCPYIAANPVITDNGDGTIDISAAEAYMKTSNAGDAEIMAVSVPETSSPIPIPSDSNYIVYVDYNSGSPIYKAMASVAGYFYTNWDELPFATVINIGSKIIVNDFSDAPINGVYKNILGQLNYQPIRYLGGLGTTEAGTRQIAVSGGAVLQGNDYAGIVSIDTSVSDSFTLMSYVTGSGWTRTASTTTINNLQYNDITTGITTLPATPEKWINYWLYYIIDSPNFWIVIMGQTAYASLAAAQAGSIPSTLPPEVSPYYAGSLLVAKIIVSTNVAANFIQIDNPFTQVFQTSAATIHDNLSGIGIAGAGVTYGHITASTQTIAGAKTFSSAVTSPNFVSTVATGTAPLTVTSTTLVNNLNSDLLDSQQGSYYLSRTNHTGTQLASTISNFSTSVSANSDVTANTAVRHVAATVVDSSTIDFTASGTNNQTITASVIESGLSLANFGDNSLTSLSDANDVQAIEVLSGTGLARRTGTDTWELYDDDIVQYTATASQQVFSGISKTVYSDKTLVFYNGALLYTGVTFNSSTEIDIGFAAFAGDIITIK